MTTLITREPRWCQRVHIQSRSIMRRLLRTKTPLSTRNCAATFPARRSCEPGNDAGWSRGVKMRLGRASPGGRFWRPTWPASPPNSPCA